ncbi:MAG: TIR domain-containing protein [Bacteroidota bacterium]
MENLSGYEYQLFISYKRNTAAEIWLDSFFYPELKKWLMEELPPGFNLKIFYDKQEIPVGSHWPKRLQHALKSSCILMPIFTSPYFSSSYCKAELESMLRRQTILGLDEDDFLNRLVYPIVFADGEHFPKDISRMQKRSMKEYASNASAFRESKKYILFEDEVKSIAADIGKILKTIPPFDSKWEVAEFLQEDLEHPAINMLPPSLNKGK